MLHRAHFNKFNAIYGPFTVDAAADNNGYNAQCSHFFCPDRSFLTAPVAGEKVWCNPPIAVAADFLTHYFQCKSQAPYTTSAVFIPPSGLLHPGLPSSLTSPWSTGFPTIPNSSPNQTALAHRHACKLVLHHGPSVYTTTPQSRNCHPSTPGLLPITPPPPLTAHSLPPDLRHLPNLLLQPLQPSLRLPLHHQPPMSPSRQTMSPTPLLSHLCRHPTSS